MRLINLFVIIVVSLLPIVAEIQLENSYKGILGKAQTIECSIEVDEVYLMYINKVVNSTDVVHLYRKVFNKQEILEAGKDMFRNDRLKMYYSKTGSNHKYKLVITELSCSDRGTYQFEFHTAKGKELKTTSLSITALPSKPSIVIDSSIPTPLNIGDSVKLRCKGDVGVPAGTLTWYELQLGKKMRLVNPTNETERLSDDCRVFKTSTIRFIATAERHNAKFICYSQEPNKNPTFSSKKDEYVIKIKSLITTTTIKTLQVKDDKEGASPTPHASLSTVVVVTFLVIHL